MSGRRLAMRRSRRAQARRHAALVHGSLLARAEIRRKTNELTETQNWDSFWVRTGAQKISDFGRELIRINVQLVGMLDFLIHAPTPVRGSVRRSCVVVPQVRQ